MKKPMIIAHRGGRSKLPENSMAAFMRAWDLRVDAVEIDVRLTADDEAVVFHDDDLLRMTGQPGRVANFTLDELRGVQLLHPRTGKPGPWYVQPLEDYIAAVPEFGTLVIELKEAGGLPGAVCAALEKGPLDHDRVILISFHLEALQKTKKWFPKITALQLFSDWHEVSERERHIRVGHILDEGLDGVDIQYNPALTSDMLAELKDGDMRVLTYTVNETEELEFAAELGIQGLTTDRPELALDLFT